MENVLVRKSIFSVDLPPRSRLYRLAPIGVGTPMGECLTSYINRLAWMYRISPRALVAQEIIPNLAGLHVSPQHLGGFCRRDAMRINGAGEVAVAWSKTLGQLTMRSDLRDLTLNLWASGLSAHGLLRVSPAWCPECYHKWREDGQSVYQPLIWMLQVMTICPLHKRLLEERCQHCQQLQSAIAVRTQPGFCTQCMSWLGTPHGVAKEYELEDEILTWQEWTISIFEELRQAAAFSESLLPWERFPAGLSACVEAVGGTCLLSHLVNVSHSRISQWRNLRLTPSLGSVLTLCYTLDISPLELIADNPTIIIRTNQVRKISWSLPLRSSFSLPVDRNIILEFIQAVLDGRELPMGSRQIERRLGLGARTLVNRFPQEYHLVTAQYQAYRAEQARQRIAQGCAEVRQAAFALYAQGIYPSSPQLAVRLSDPNILRRPEGLSALHAVRRELELE